MVYGPEAATDKSRDSRPPPVSPVAIRRCCVTTMRLPIHSASQGLTKPKMTKNSFSTSEAISPFSFSVFRTSTRAGIHFYKKMCFVTHGIYNRGTEGP